MKRNFFVFSVIQAIIFCFSCRLFALGGLKGNNAAEAHLKMIHTDKEKHEQSCLQLKNMAYVAS